MGAVDNLSKEVKEYTTIYTDVLVGIHNDMKSTKKEMSNLKIETNSAIKKLNTVQFQAKEIITYGKDIVKEIKATNSNISLQKTSIENFINYNKEEIYAKQENLEDLIKNTENYIQEKIEKFTDIETNIKNEYYLLLEKTNDLTIEITMLEKLLKEQNIKNIELEKMLHNLKKGFEKQNTKSYKNTVITYTLLLFLTFIFIYKNFF